MRNVSTVQELEAVLRSVQSAGFTGDIQCGGDVVKDVRTFFSTYQRSNEQGWIKTGGALLALGLTVATGGLGAVALAAGATVGLAASVDYDRKATKRMSLGDLCYELAAKGYKMKQNRHDTVLLSI